MLRMVLTLVLLRQSLKAVAGTKANATVASAIGGAVNSTDVVAAATGIIAVVGGIVVTLKLGPGWAFKMVSKMVRAVK